MAEKAAAFQSRRAIDAAAAPAATVRTGQDARQPEAPNRHFSQAGGGLVLMGKRGGVAVSFSESGKIVVGCGL